MIQDEICTYEVAELAKRKGFNVPTFGYYRIDTEDWCRTDVYDDWNDSTIRYSAPTQSLLQRWLREERGIHINICAAYGWKIERTDGNILLPHNNLDHICTHLRSSDVTWEDNCGCFDTYELALEDALKYALENLA